MLKKIKTKVLLVVPVVSALAFTLIGTCSAAEDADFATTSTAVQALITDNKTSFIALLIALAIAGFGIVLAKGSLIMGMRWINKALFGGRKRR